MRAWETMRRTEVARGAPAQARQGAPGTRPPGQRRRPRCALLRLGLVGAVLLGLAGGPLRAWAQDELFVANFGTSSITVYTRTASGDTAPLRTLSGALTGLSGPEGVVVDTVNNELVVANLGTPSITVYTRTASGNTAPLRTLSGALTGLSGPVGVVVDTVNNELVVANIFNNSITVYTRTASGNTAPLRTLSGVDTGLSNPEGVVVDTVHNELVVGNGNNSITVYDRTAVGNDSSSFPLRTLSGALTGLSNPKGVVVDMVNNELVVANFSTPSITVYTRTASGNTAPLRTLSGALTGMDAPIGVVVDTVHNELVVGNFTNHSITVYTRTASGNTAPLRTLSGALTGLSEPAFIAVTTSATLTVTNPGDTGAPGQLRTLITQAAPGDVIVIPAGTITLSGAADENANASGDLDISKNLTIQGAGAGVTIIDGGGIDRVFDINPFGQGHISVVISGVTIRGGRAEAGASSGANQRTRGAGADPEGTLNDAGPGFGGGARFGSMASGIYMDTTFLGNSASEGGGAIAIKNGSDPVKLIRVTLSDNSTGHFGGAISNGGAELTLINSTLSGNSSGDFGGGIMNFVAGSVMLNNVTLSNNSAKPIGGGGGIFNGGGSDKVKLENTIVAKQFAGADCAGPITSVGHNLDSDDTCHLTQLSDKPNVPPALLRLGPLQDNGGPTQTHALLPGSPAIDAGVPAGCTDDLGALLTTDQRGFARPQDGNGDGLAICDIGAYEVSGLVADPVTAFVTRLYQTVLLRDPDAPGLAAHVADIQSFGTVIPTVLAFFHSAEFLSQPLTDDQFLDRLYHTFLNRDPDPAGLQAFQDLLASGCRTRDTLIAALTFSDEFRSLVPPLPVADLRVPFVAELYAWILNRPPDPALQGWVTQLQRSTALATVLSFLHSPEFTTPRRDTATYVNSLYLAFLGRPPDCGGLTFWVTTLTQQGDTDAARDQVAGQFAGSQEFRAKLDQLFP